MILIKLTKFLVSKPSPRKLGNKGIIRLPEFDIQSIEQSIV